MSAVPDTVSMQNAGVTRRRRGRPPAAAAARRRANQMQHQPSPPPREGGKVVKTRWSKASTLKLVRAIRRVNHIQGLRKASGIKHTAVNKWEEAARYLRDCPMSSDPSFPRLCQRKLQELCRTYREHYRAQHADANGYDFRSRRPRKFASQEIQKEVNNYYNNVPWPDPISDAELRVPASASTYTSARRQAGGRKGKKRGRKRKISQVREQSTSASSVEQESFSTDEELSMEPPHSWSKGRDQKDGEKKEMKSQMAKSREQEQEQSDEDLQEEELEKQSEEKGGEEEQEEENDQEEQEEEDDSEAEEGSGDSEEDQGEEEEEHLFREWELEPFDCDGWEKGLQIAEQQQRNPEHDHEWHQTPTQWQGTTASSQLNQVPSEKEPGLVEQISGQRQRIKELERMLAGHEKRQSDWERRLNERERSMIQREQSFEQRFSLRERNLVEQEKILEQRFNEQKQSLERTFNQREQNFEERRKNLELSLTEEEQILTEQGRSSDQMCMEVERNLLDREQSVRIIEREQSPVQEENLTGWELSLGGSLGNGQFGSEPEHAQGSPMKKGVPVERDAATDFWVLERPASEKGLPVEKNTTTDVKVPEQGPAIHMERNTATDMPVPEPKAQIPPLPPRTYTAVHHDQEEKRTSSRFEKLAAKVHGLTEAIKFEELARKVDGLQASNNFEVLIRKVDDLAAELSKEAMACKAVGTKTTTTVEELARKIDSLQAMMVSKAP